MTASEFHNVVRYAFDLVLVQVWARSANDLRLQAIHSTPKVFRNLGNPFHRFRSNHNFAVSDVAPKFCVVGHINTVCQSNE